jgi:hypothetical protein
MKPEPGRTTQMLAKEQEPTEPWGDSGGQLQASYEPLCKVLFGLAVVLFLMAEGIGIHALWFAPRQPVSILKRCNLSLYMTLPLLWGFIVYIGIGKMSKAGQVSIAAAAQLRFYLGSMMIWTYLAILQLVDGPIH